MKKRIGVCIIFSLLAIFGSISFNNKLYARDTNDFNSLKVADEGGTAMIEGKSYSFMNTANGVRAFSKQQVSSTPTTWKNADALANNYRNTLNPFEKSIFTSSSLPSYQDFQKYHDPSNQNLLRQDIARGSSNWWLKDTQGVRLGLEANQPSNTVYASRIVSGGRTIENSKGAQTYAFKGYNTGITNYHTIGIQNGSFQTPQNYALNNNYTLGNKDYEYKDTQVKMALEQRPSRPGYQPALKYNFAQYDWDYYRTSAAIQNAPDQITIRNSVSNTGGTTYKFWDLMLYNEGQISIIAELDMKNSTKNAEGRIQPKVNRYYSNYSSLPKNYTLQEGKQYVVFLPNGYPGRAIQESIATIELGAGTNIHLTKGKTGEYGYWNKNLVGNAMLETYGWSSDIPYYVGDVPLVSGIPVDASVPIMLYDGNRHVYAGPASNIMLDGKLKTYTHTTYTKQTSNLKDVGGWGFMVVCRQVRPDSKGIATLSSSSGQAMIYLDRPISNSQANIPAGFYEVRRPSYSTAKLQIKNTQTEGSVRQLMINTYVQQRNGVNVTIPKANSFANYTNISPPGSSNVYDTYKNRGLSIGTASIWERLPATNVSGYQAYAYPMLSMNTEKIAYVDKTSEQKKVQPILKETKNTISNQGGSQVLFAFTDKLSWAQNRKHLLNENFMTNVGTDGKTLHVQGGNRYIKFYVKPITGIDNIDSSRTLYVSAASETKDGKKVYGRIGQIFRQSETGFSSCGVATIDLENLMDYKTPGTTKQVRLYIEAVSEGAEMNYVSETPLSVTIDITEPNHMTLSFPTYVELDQGKADVNLSVVDYSFHEENVPSGFVPKLETSIPSIAGQTENTLKVQDTKGKADLILKIQPPDTTVLQGNEIGIGKVLTYKLLGDGTQGSDRLSNGMWKGMLKLHVKMELYP